jgi:hypothetical protein
MLSKWVTSSVTAGGMKTLITAGGVTLEAATVSGSWLPDSTFAGMTTATAMVIAVMATAAMPLATRGTDDG